MRNATIAFFALIFGGMWMLLLTNILVVNGLMDHRVANVGMLLVAIMVLAIVHNEMVEK